MTRLAFAGAGAAEGGGGRAPGLANRPASAQQAPAAAAAALVAGSRALLQSTTEVGTGNPDQTIPSTAAVVAGVVGGLSTLTLCLAVALLVAVASIYGYRLCGGRRRRRGSSAATSKSGTPAGGTTRRTDLDFVLEMQRSATQQLPSIVTTRLAPPSDGAGAAVEELGASKTDKSSSPVSTNGGSGTARTPLRSDASWKDCLIDPEQIQILRRRDGKPWVLGGGAFGQVYKALYDGVQVVAAKVLTGLRDERIFQGFVREAAILRGMRDKNIVQFVGVCMGSEEEGQPDEAMMIQEFMEAGDLFKALKWRDEAGLRVFGWYARGKRAAIDVARGLHYLHSHKTVHLDVKSSNVLLARDGSCKLADVGLARNLLTKNYLTHAGTLGTFAWSAPEVLTGQQCTTSADIYSFGIVLWEIVTGEIPSRGAMRNPRVPEECPQAVIDLMDRCLELEPRQRPTAKEIVQLLEGMPVGTPSAADARGAPLRTASLAHWRNQLPQQVSTFMPGSPSLTLTEGAEEELAALGMSTLSNDAEVLEAAAERAQQQGAQQPAAPTLRLQDLPPLSDSERLF